MTSDATPTGVSPAAPADGDKAAKSSAENLDKVRDILFGSQAREYEKRFARLEEKLINEASDLREDLKRRFDTLEIYIKREVEALSSRLKAEHEERSEASRVFLDELKNITHNFDRRTDQIDQQLMTSERQLRDQLLDQSKTMTDEIRQKYEALGQSLQRATAELRDEKTDRAALASMFMEVAMRLNNQFKMPEPEDR
jgi:hypothetical protein